MLLTLADSPVVILADGIPAQLWIYIIFAALSVLGSLAGMLRKKGEDTEEELEAELEDKQRPDTPVRPQEKRPDTPVRPQEKRPETPASPQRTPPVARPTRLETPPTPPQRRPERPAPPVRIEQPTARQREIPRPTEPSERPHRRLSREEILLQQRGARPKSRAAERQTAEAVRQAEQRQRRAADAADLRRAPRVQRRTHHRGDEVREWLADRQGLQRAIILNEILGPPVSLRDPSRRTP